MSSTNSASRFDLLKVRPDGNHDLIANCTLEQVKDQIYRRQLSEEDRIRVAGTAHWQELASRDEFDGDLARPERRKGLQSPREQDEMDMTPMIDVTFLLLIFFMVTASFHLQKGLDFPTSQADPLEAASNQPLPGLPSFDDRIIIEISAVDVFQFKDAKTGTSGTPIPADQLTATIREKSSADNTKNKLLIIAHEASSHEATVAVIDAAAQAGVIDVSLADVVSQGVNSGGSNTIIRNP